MTAAFQELLEYFQKVPSRFAKQFADLLGQFLNKVYEIQHERIKMQKAADNASQQTTASGKTFRRAPTPPFVNRDAQLADLHSDEKPKAGPR